MTKRYSLFGVNRDSGLANSTYLHVAAAVGFAGFGQHGHGSCIVFIC